jgi:hypothetical protein
VVKYFFHFLLLIICSCTTVIIRFEDSKTSETKKKELDGDRFQLRTIDTFERLYREYADLNDICPENWTLLEVEFYREVPLSAICEGRSNIVE